MKTPALLLLTLAPVLFAQDYRLPPDLAPEIHAWFPDAGFFQPEGYRTAVDVFAEHSNFGLLTTSIRSPQHEIVLAGTHDQMKRAVAYAHSRGLRIALDLDIRLARQAFQVRYPEQQQWMLRLRSFPASSDEVRIDAAALRDHMGEYQLLAGRLMRIWIRSGTGLHQLTQGCRATEESARRVAVSCAPEVLKGAGELIVAAAFEYRTPDVFAPALLPFQNEILAQYRDIPLDGTMKDEWGFPPVFNHGGKDGDFWYSVSFANEYRKAGGGEFIDDCLLMWTGASPDAVNRYMRLVLERNAAIEREYYEASKRIFGRDTFVAVHATWGFMPYGDAFKNGYSWWAAKRDYGQTDEHWPLPVRTSLAHKMGQAVWYNQFYATRTAPYAKEVWRNARAGGRVNFHPLYPAAAGTSPLALLESPAMKAEARVRLLNFVTRAPLDCPVAVVFGHPAALNWLGAHFGDLGVDFAEALWDQGIPTDVIPSSEIASGALQISPEGHVSYGSQRYRALVFINSDYEPPETFAFLRQAALSKTELFTRGVEPQVPGAHAGATPSLVAQSLWNWHSERRSAPYDLARLTDGTCILARGEKDPAGDDIQEDFTCGRTPVHAEATGVLAIRLDSSGRLIALAGSGLRRVDAGEFHLKLAKPVDLALWRAGTELHGVVQGVSAIPAELSELTQHWQSLAVYLPAGATR